MSFNKIIIIGNLGRDPELRYTPQGSAVCSFSVATNEKKRDKAGEQQDITTWFRVTLWNKTAENAAKYLTKGSPVYVEGRLRIDEWTDRDGNNRYTLEVQGTDMHFISSGRGGEDYSGQPASENEFAAAASSSAATTSGDAPSTAPAVPSTNDDEIPF